MITVDILRRDCVVVVAEPTLWERLLLRRTEERIAISLPSINQTIEWFWEATARPVPREVRRAIDQAFVTAEWTRILSRRGNQ